MLSPECTETQPESGERVMSEFESELLTLAKRFVVAVEQHIGTNRLFLEAAARRCAAEATIAEEEAAYRCTPAGQDWLRLTREENLRRLREDWSIKP